MNTTVENNKLIEGFPNYEISCEGYVTNVKTKRVLKFSNSRYLSVSLRLNGKSFQKTIHRLVALHFIPNLEKKSDVNHKDGNKYNNRVDNLEWVTRSENVKHAFDNGLNKYTNELKEVRRVARVGYKTPEETKDKIKLSLSKKVLCVEDNIIFNSINDASLYSKLSKTTFHRRFKKGDKIDDKTYILYNQ